MDQYLYGALSGMVGLTLSHPFDTLKSNIQTGNRVPFRLLIDPRFLYKGYVPPLFGMGLEKSVVFGTFHNVKMNLPQEINELQRIALAGAASGFAASFIVSPYERLKIQLQTGQKLTLEHLRPSRLFIGLSATFTRETPGFAIYFSNYEYWKKRWWTQNDLDIDPISSFFLGGSSGIAAWIFIYPQD